MILKPDAVARGLVGEILARFERKGLSFVAVDLRTLDDATLRAHYAEHAGKPFLEPLVALMSSGPSLLAVLEGPGEDTVGIVRNLLGATDPASAAPGTIRGDLGLALPANLVHGSDSPATAAAEIARFFPALG